MPSTISGSQIAAANLLIGGTYLSDTISTIESKVSNNYLQAQSYGDVSNNYLQAQSYGTGDVSNTYLQAQSYGNVSNNYLQAQSYGDVSNNYITSTFASNNYIQANVGGTSANVIFVNDTVSGCPPTRAAGTQIMRIDFTLDKASYFEVHYQTIANYSSRVDHYIVVDGVTQGSVLTSTSSSSWKPVNLTYAGYLSAGSHHTYITCSRSNVTGCGSTWGRGYVIIYE